MHYFYNHKLMNVVQELKLIYKNKEVKLEEYKRLKSRKAYSEK